MSEPKTEVPRHLTTYHLTALRHGAGAVVESLRDVPEGEMLAAERGLRDRCREILSLTVLDETKGD